ncbi:protein HGH1 homolog isoform X2 [Branchiostoma floridae]|uniref:Protein HGH1 homolog n=1 Tax=Branchiostoma floridae TaxID=7739 RepID=A0A9J7HQD5_BRAFL|nr:protein HGH1 homolog isoform X2 [Branchiostoma floridae]
MGDQQQLEELLPFLSLTSRPDVRATALQYLLGVTASKNSAEFFLKNKVFIKKILSLTEDSEATIAKDAYLCLINLTADGKFCKALLEDYDPVPKFVHTVTDSESEYADSACMILSNVTREESGAERVLDSLVKGEVGLAKVVEVFCQEGYNKNGKQLHYIGPMLSNLTQLREARQFVLDRDRCVVQRLLPFTQYQGSVIRRGGIVGALKNCCFETVHHEWLLSDDVDILPFLLLPLAGPEEFAEDEMEKLPDELQYLGEDKQREEEPSIRQMLLETLLQLCATKHGRKTLRDKHVYYILRELHTWESQPELKEAVENVVQILISDEPEDVDNLKDMQIPEGVQKQLDQLQGEGQQ